MNLHGKLSCCILSVDIRDDVPAAGGRRRSARAITKCPCTNPQQEPALHAKVLPASPARQFHVGAAPWHGAANFRRCGSTEVGEWNGTNRAHQRWQHVRASGEAPAPVTLCRCMALFLGVSPRLQ